MTPEKDYTHKGWIALTALIAVLVGVSFIPPQTIGGIQLRRANILADLIAFEDTVEAAEEPELFDEADFHIDMEQVAERIDADTLPKSVQTNFEWQVGKKARVSCENIRPDTTCRQMELIPIEDFDTTGMSPLKRFYDRLLAGEHSVRIAVLGDSFIEGDILTADLREKLQTAYGGGGAGFAPMASPLTGFRRTIKTQSKGWTAYNIMQRKAAPQHFRDNFYISGWVCQPTAGASTRWENTDARLRLDSCATARIFFISPRSSRIEIGLNDSLTQTFAVEGASSVRQATVSAPHIRSLSFKVLSGHEDFIGYGALFEGPGLVVDNYSVRSNNGQAMFWTNPSVNAQINTMLNYDLVILQYGLNIMQTGIHSYANYSLQIEKMVAYVRQCFPTAAVLILGVSDRSVKTDTGFEPMDAIPHMLSWQRRAAENTGAAFWPTCDAMRALGGMERFVANGWAGKDFTHINYAGGRQIARALFDALNAGVSETYVQTQAETQRKQEQQSILDSLHIVRIEKELLPDVVPEASFNNLPQ